MLKSNLSRIGKLSDFPCCLPLSCHFSDTSQRKCSAFKGSSDQLVPIQIIQYNFPILRFVNLNYVFKSPFCHIPSANQRSWKFEYGFWGKQLFSLTHYRNVCISVFICLSVCLSISLRLGAEEPKREMSKNISSLLM